MKQLQGGFRNIPGFTSTGKHIGIKKRRKDFAVLCSDRVCTCAAVYTSNQVQGAPLIVTREHLNNHSAQAVVVNSGVANVATGEQGRRNAIETAQLVAAELGIKVEDVLVASTGVIGPQLPMEKIRVGVKGLKSELRPDGEFAEGILTTDTCQKEICVSMNGFKIAGCAKGSGMIAPNMATMLAFIVTDAAVDGAQLSKILRRCVDDSFNMLSVDMDTSTSDMALVMSNGSVPVDMGEFEEALGYVCRELAKMIARDGEGATKLIISQSQNGHTQADAHKVAKAIISSNLVKTAIYGNDPNWGRLMMAIGNSGAERIDQDKIRIWVNHILIVENGAAAPEYDASKLRAILSSAEEVTITVDLGAGTYNAEAYGCDMSQEYIRINAEYTT